MFDILDIVLTSRLIDMIYPFTSSPFSCKLFNLGIGGTFPTHALMRDPPTDTVQDPQSPLWFGNVKNVSVHEKIRERLLE